MTKYNHLNIDQRSSIQYMLDHKKNFSDISKAINVDRTTISKEIRRNRYIKSNFYTPFDNKGIQKAIHDCVILSNPPYICNNCPIKYKCSKHKLYYNYTVADEHYNDILKSSRVGVDISSGEADEIERVIVPLIKKKHQSINQLYINHPDVLLFSKVTFYNYVNLGVLSLSNLDLPKKVKYKVRKKKSKETRYKRELFLLNGRRYNDFLEYIGNNPNANIVEMDTVIGKQENKKVLFTIFIRKTNFMLIRLINKKNMKYINIEIDKIKATLGVDLYKSIFEVVLTDNGCEFFDPLNMELNYDTGEKIINVFYCEAYSSWQKGGIEKNHQYIRMFYPKGHSFENLTDEIVQKMEENINNVPRNSLNGKTPYQATKELFPELINKLKYKCISPDEVSLSRHDLTSTRKSNN